MSKIYSFSQKKMYATCPRKYQLAYIGKDRKKELPSDCMMAGSDGHREIANYLKGGVKPVFLPENFDGFIARLGQGDRLIEEKIDIDFFGFGLTGYIDLVIIDGQKASIVDWKTGYLDGDIEQLKIYASAILERNPDILVFSCYFYYTGKNGHWTREIFTKDEIEDYMNQLESDLSEIHEAKEYPATVNPYCKTCPHSLDCFEAQKYAFLAIRNEQEFIAVMQKKELAEAYAEQAKDVMKQWMCENGQTTVIDGITKAYLGTTVTMRTGKLKKDEIIDIIVEHDVNQDKKVLGKFKVDELATILSEISAKGIQQEAEIEAVETMIDMAAKEPGIIYLSGCTPVGSPRGMITISDVADDIPPDELPFSYPVEVEVKEIKLDVHQVNSATKKEDLYTAFEALLSSRGIEWLDYCGRRGLCKETPLDGLTREKMYQEYKILARAKPENVPEKITLGVIRKAAIDAGIIDVANPTAWEDYMTELKKLYGTTSLLNLDENLKQEILDAINAIEGESNV